MSRAAKPAGPFAPAGAPARWQRALASACLVIFLAAFGSIFAVAALRGRLGVSANSAALFVLLAGGFFCLARFGLPRLSSLSPRAWAAVFWGGLGLLLALQLGSGFLLLNDHTTAPFDTEAVYRTATQLAAGQVPAEYNDYFVSCESNTLCMFVLYWLYRLVFLLGGALSPVWGMLLNTALLWLAALFTCKAALLLWGRAGGGAALALCLLFLPLYIFTPFLYTDPMAAPLVAASLYCFVRLRRRWAFLSPKGRLVRAAGLGALLGLAFLMKGNALVLVPALGLWCLFSLPLKGRGRQALGLVLAVALAAGLVIGGFKAYVRGCGLIDFSGYDALHMPLTHWIMMGLEHDGAYNSENFVYSGSYPTVAEKKAAIAARIGTNLQALAKNPVALAWLMYTKAGTDWADGLYGSPGAAAFAPVRATWLSEWFTSTGAYAGVTGSFGQAFHWLLWLCGFGLVLRALRQKKPGGFALAAALCLLGNLAFLSLWEANARYAFCFFSCLVLLAAGFLSGGRAGQDINNEQEVTPLGKR